MTRERAKELAPIIAAYGEGKSIQAKSEHGDWLDMGWPDFDSPALKYRVKPEPKKRLMTRGETIYKALNTPNMVVRIIIDLTWQPAMSLGYTSTIDMYEWNTIDEHGATQGEWRKFEIEEV